MTPRIFEALQKKPCSHRLFTLIVGSETVLCIAILIILFSTPLALSSIGKTVSLLSALAGVVFATFIILKRLDTKSRIIVRITLILALANATILIAGILSIDNYELYEKGRLISSILLPLWLYSDLTRRAFYESKK